MRGLSQAVVVYALALVLGIKISHEFGHALGRFMGIGQALTMPIFFASNAI